LVRGHAQPFPARVLPLAAAFTSGVGEAASVRSLLNHDERRWRELTAAKDRRSREPDAPGHDRWWGGDGLLIVTTLKELRGIQ
jgi:hypothetical protein